MHCKYQFKRIQFGLHIGSSALSHYLDGVLEGLKFVTCVSYADDVIIYSEDHASHKLHVREVLDRLEKHNLTVNSEKAQFFETKVKWLGNLITNGTTTIDPERTKAKANAKPPKDLKSCRKWIGLCSFFSKFIPYFSEICRPINELKRKHVKFKWTTECQESFEKLKTAITNYQKPVLRLAKGDKRFTLACDASFRVAGACFMQKDELGVLNPITYYSISLTNVKSD